MPPSTGKEIEQTWREVDLLEEELRMMWEVHWRSKAERSVRPLQEPMRDSGDAGRGENRGAGKGASPRSRAF